MDPLTAISFIIIFGVLGTILMVAGVFAFLPLNYAISGSVICYIIAGAVKKLTDSLNRRKGHKW